MNSWENRLKDEYNSAIERVMSSKWTLGISLVVIVGVVVYLAFKF